MNASMSNNPTELFRAGRLDEAVDAALSLVKARPTEVELRYQLAEMACVAGQLDRADRQLDTVIQQFPRSAVGASLTRQLVRAELSRRECFQQGRVPDFLAAPGERVELHIRAIASLREGDIGEAVDCLAEATELEQPVALSVDGRPVNAIRDLDDLLAPVLEVHTSTGKYFWVPWSQIVELELHAPARPMDLIWRQATLSVADGPTGEVYLPAVYPNPTGEAQAESLRMGRSTDWLEVSSALVRGQGQKMLLAGEEEVAFMELKSIASADDDSADDDQDA
ncbi:MAG: type VI secretion system accessory protein TagJ [Planctomycetota bacterium]